MTSTGGSPSPKRLSFGADEQRLASLAAVRDSGAPLEARIAALAGVDSSQWHFARVCAEVDTPHADADAYLVKLEVRFACRAGVRG